MGDLHREPKYSDVLKLSFLSVISARHKIEALAATSRNRALQGDDNVVHI